ncbi:hypothetical protein, partial [Pseudomonas marincola]|uniref:hypothetical protein n=1 Tax=Pseudomonas marincola TaxID=437900 RepID=UPI003002CE52
LFSKKFSERSTPEEVRIIGTSVLPSTTNFSFMSKRLNLNLLSLDDALQTLDYAYRTIEQSVAITV